MWRRHRWILVALGLSSSVAACDLVLGLDDFADPPPEGTGGTEGAGAAPGGGGGVGGQGGTASGAGGGLPQGKVLWARSFGGPEQQLAETLAVGPNEEVVIAGSTNGAIDFTWDGSACATPSPLSPVDGGDPFVIVLDSEGCNTEEAIVPTTGGGSINDVAVAGTTLWAVGGFIGTLLPGGGALERTSQGVDVFWSSLSLDGVVMQTGTLAQGNPADEGEPEVVVTGSQVLVSARVNVTKQSTEIVDADIRIDEVMGGQWGSWFVSSTGVDQIHAMDHRGDNLIVAGEIGGIGADFAGLCGIVDADGKDGFVASIDAATSNCQWVTLFTGGGPQGVQAVASGEDAIYVGGSFEGGITLPSGVTELSVERDAFVAKLELDGTFLWAELSRASGEESVEAIDVTASGNVVVGGLFSSALGFVEASSPNSGNRDGYVMLLDGSGAVQWFSVLAGGNSQTIHDVAAAGGSIYALGSHRAPATLGSVMLPHVAGAEPNRDIIVAKFDEVSAAR